MPYPLIVDIKRHSHEDGPGIRSVVFFKGCPLRCIHCHNPETQEPGLEIAFFSQDCLQCGRCAEACPEGAVDLALPERIRRDVCTRCGRCAEVCPGGALRCIGEYMAPECLVEMLERDLPFYRHSGGGVTLSGGECTRYPDYLESLLIGLKKSDIHVALETCGEFDYDAFQRKILPRLDLIFFDLKFADEETHRKYTGRSNRRILENLRRLLLNRPNAVHLRIPVVPGVTATDENLAGLIAILHEAEASEVTLLPYNPLGLAMYDQLGKPTPPLPRRFMSPEEEKAVRSRFQALVKKRFRAHAGPQAPPTPAGNRSPFKQRGSGLA
jgi:pyruvate formate lyase activating enzyme